jgi:alkyldihydroxyacetonephosphate synthase
VAVHRERVADLAEALGRVTAPSRVSVSPPDRLTYARDLWPRGLLAVAAGDVAPYPPDAIVWPTSTAEVQAIVRLCIERRVPIVPFGAGSGVCGGAIPIRGGVVVDVKRMRALRVDEDAMTVTAEAGINGEHLEHALARRGYTLGHFPSSIMCSTLGGWVAARSAGQCSSRYGKIEDMVRSVELVTGAGDVLDTAAGEGAGFDWNPLLVGSEGVLGIFTRATLRIHRQPAVRFMRGFRFARVEAGCEAIRRVMQRGLRPSVVRLYDELDTAMQRWSRGGAARRDGSPLGGDDERAGEGLLSRVLRAAGLGGTAGLRHRAIAAALERPLLANRAVDALGPRSGVGCLLIAGCEGEPDLAEAESKAVFHELHAAGGRDLGAAPGERWLAHRYDVSFGLSRIFQTGAFADTMEVATTWSRLMPLYRAVRAAVAPHAFIMAHFSHAYEDGCSIYFTFAAAAPHSDGRAGAERRYDRIWRAGLAAVSEAGATISHHHGVGMSKAAFLPAEHGESLRVLGALKRTFDPHGIMNPGKLGL